MFVLVFPWLTLLAVYINESDRHYDDDDDDDDDGY